MVKLARYTLLLLAILMLGTALRLVGLTRGYSELPGQQPTFYSFHPDERTLLQAAGQLDRLTDPPLTAYGPVPMLLAKLWLNGTALIAGYDALNTDTPAHQPTLFIAARLLAIVLALATLYGMYRLGSALFNPATAALATLWVAAVPLAIQQAHFYTIDGVFTLVVVLFFWALHSALTTHKPGFYLLCGLLIGVAGGVRFNGVLLGLILVAGHLVSGPAASLWTRLSRQARQANLWWATGTALVVFFALQPYILLQPERLWQLKGTDDFLYSAQIANGTLLRPWSLVDLHTVPYLHYWTHLWPTGVGWPLTVGFGLGLGYALYRGGLWRWLVLGWIGLYFMPVGALHTKHVRYLLPLLPFCCLLTANALLKLPEHLPIKNRAQGRRFVHIAVGVLVLATVLHGLAFARVYTQQDSRLQASRWIQDNIPAGSTIAVERGGFSMRGLINWQRYTYRSLDTSSLFGTRGYCSCQASYEFFKGRLEPAQYIVLLPVNRARQYAAAPEVLPAMTAFYQRLAAGQLGFERVARFKVEPGLARLRFNDDHAEPSFLGYDHPTVWIFKRTGGFASDWENWRYALTTTPYCDDQAFKEFADLINAGQLDQALGKIQSLEPTHSLRPLAALVEAYIYQLQKQSGQSQAALTDYVAGYQNIALANHLLPWASSLSLVGIGLDHLALNALADGAGRCHSFHRAHYGTMVASYQEMADRFNDRDQPSFARQALQLANQIRPQANTYGALAELARRADDHDEAWTQWQQSLKLDSTQANVHQHLGRTALRHRHNYPLALEHLTRALELDSTRADSLKPLIAEARLLTNGKAP